MPEPVPPASEKNTSTSDGSLVALIEATKSSSSFSNGRSSP